VSAVEVVLFGAMWLLLLIALYLARQTADDQARDDARIAQLAVRVAELEASAVLWEVRARRLNSERAQRARGAGL